MCGSSQKHSKNHSAENGHGAGFKRTKGKEILLVSKDRHRRLCFCVAVPDSLAPDVYLSSTETAAELQYGIDLFGLFLPEL